MDTVWRDPFAEPMQLRGFPWAGTERLFRRFPLHPADPLPASVYNGANSTAGGQLLFRTDSTRVIIRVKLAASSSMYHMPATGQCGFDLYIGHGAESRYHRTARFERDDVEYECPLFESTRSEMREFTINFPLYQGVSTLEIGLDVSASLEAPGKSAMDGCVIAYGTSITQGGCASRPGLAYTNILSRKLDLEVVNLGFSGAGRGEPEVIRTIATIQHPSLFILDYEANTESTEHLTSTLPRAIEILRTAHTQSSILVVSRVPFARDITDESSATERIRSKDLQHDIVQSLRDGGDSRIFFLDGADLLGEDGDECTVDGIHPNDLGFKQMADRLFPVIKRILHQQK